MCHISQIYRIGVTYATTVKDRDWTPVEAMRIEHSDAGLLKDNPWEDDFMILHYYIWYHDGRRARQGAMMGAPDWAHWHGFFLLQQKLNQATEIYNYRMETGEIETIGTAIKTEG